jgi:hypothetical protein
LLRFSMPQSVGHTAGRYVNDDCVELQARMAVSDVGGGEWR